MKRIYLATIILLCFVMGGIAQRFHQNYLDGVIYLKVHDTVPVQLDPYRYDLPLFNELIQTYGILAIKKAFYSQNLHNIYRLEFADWKRTDELISRLMSMDFVDYAEKMPLYTNLFTPNDLDQRQWYLLTINAPDAWDLSKGNREVTIAVVDNAVSTTHLDLMPNIWVNPGEIPGNGQDDDQNGFIDDINGYDVADGDNDPNPPAGITNSSSLVHGTFVAGIASSATNNGTGVSSLGFQSSIIAVKVSRDTTTTAFITHAFEGIDYAISAGADVINMSFGSRSTSITSQLLIREANNQGIVLIAAAGNDNSEDEQFPAAFREVLAVGATNDKDLKASFSNFGTWVDIMAPGTGILSTLPESDNTYGFASGTSAACPVVSGLAALVIAQNPGFSPAQVKQKIREGAVDIDKLNPGFEGKLGSGRIDAFKTLSGVTAVQESTDNEIDVAIYPNPGKGRFHINVSDGIKEELKLTVSDIIGNIVLQKSIFSNQDGIVIDLTGKEPGVYLLMIESVNFRITRKIMIEK